MESRNGNQTLAARAQAAPLPVDFLKMVTDVFTTHFTDGLAALGKLVKSPKFVADGAVFPNEVVLCVSLQFEGQLAATTAYASCDFDPKASSPTIQDLLGACVDAMGTLYDSILVATNPKKLEQIADESLASFEGVPFDWAKVEVERYRVYLKVDKSNPALDRMADDWLAKHDPDAVENERKDREKTEKLFVTGEKVKKKAGKNDPSPVFKESDSDTDTDSDPDSDPDDSGPLYH